MKIGDSTTGTETELYEISPTMLDHILDSKILKPCSSTTAEATRPSPSSGLDADHILDSKILKPCSSTAAEATGPSPSSGLDADHILDSKILKPCSSTAAEATRPSPSSGLDADHIHVSKRLRQYSSTAVEATSPSIVSLLVSDPIHHSKRLKRSSSAAPPIRTSSNLMSINIDDLPEAVLVEILCRLPSYKYVSQCKCVSKRWCTLMSDPCFIRPFLSLQRDSDQMVHTLINKYGEEFLDRLSSSRESLAPLFQRLMRFHRLEKEPVVLGTYNDLVLCSESYRYQRDYYICNPCTYQWVHLPPPPQVHEFTKVGFICDLPYYQCKEVNDDQKEGKHIQVNSDYKGRVVRLILTTRMEFVSEFKVHIFSTETGEWTESIVSSPSLFCSGHIHGDMYYPYKGVLYWMDYHGNFLLGLDPFMITERTPGDPYKCRFIQFERPADRIYADRIYDNLTCLGEYRGCLQMSSDAFELDDGIITIWELNEEATSGEASKFCLENTGVDYEPEWEMPLNDTEIVQVIGFDPNNDGTLYLNISDSTNRCGGIAMYKMKTRLCSRIKSVLYGYPMFYKLALPCLPTPVPRRQAASSVGSQPSR